jgi:hypothetical protein
MMAPSPMHIQHSLQPCPPKRQRNQSGKLNPLPLAHAWCHLMRRSTPMHRLSSHRHCYSPRLSLLWCVNCSSVHPAAICWKVLGAGAHLQSFSYGPVTFQGQVRGSRSNQTWFLPTITCSQMSLQQLADWRDHLVEILRRKCCFGRRRLLPEVFFAVNKELDLALVACENVGNHAKHIDLPLDANDLAVIKRDQIVGSRLLFVGCLRGGPQATSFGKNQVGWSQKLSSKTADAVFCLDPFRSSEKMSKRFASCCFAL